MSSLVVMMSSSSVVGAGFETLVEEDEEGLIVEAVVVLVGCFSSAGGVGDGISVVEVTMSSIRAIVVVICSSCLGIRVTAAAATCSTQQLNASSQSRPRDGFRGLIIADVVMEKKLSSGEFKEGKPERFPHKPLQRV